MNITVDPPSFYRLYGKNKIGPAPPKLDPSIETLEVFGEQRSLIDSHSTSTSSDSMKDISDPNHLTTILEHLEATAYDAKKEDTEYSSHIKELDKYLLSIEAQRKATRYTDLQEQIEKLVTASTEMKELDENLEDVDTKQYQTIWNTEETKVQDAAPTETEENICYNEALRSVFGS